MSLSPTSSMSTTRVGTLASSFSATTASTGSTISRLAALASAMILLRGRGEVVLDQRLADLAWPCASRNVLAMAPPMISTSTFCSRWPSRSSLVEILAPPTMAASGRCGLSSAFSKRFELGLHACGRHRPAARCAEALGRGMRAMRGREGVVDADVAELGERGDESRIVLLLAGVKAGVLQAEDVAVASSPRPRARPASPMQSSANVDRPLDDVRDLGGHRLERILRIAPLRAGRNARAGSPCRPCRRSR